MTINIGINGFGRIGRLALRRILSIQDSNVNVSAINDLTDPRLMAQLFKYDSTHGTYPGDVTFDDQSITVDGKRISVYAERDAAEIP